MCFETTKWAIQQDISAGEKLTLIALAFFKNHTTDLCNPKHESIAKIASSGISTIKSHLSALKKSGHIEIHHNVVNGNQLNNNYTFPMYTGPESGYRGPKSDPLGGRNLATNNKELLNKEIHIQDASEEAEKYDGEPEEKTLAHNDGVPYEAIVAAYHECLPNLPRKLKLMPPLKSAIKARWREDKRHRDIEFWRRYFDSVNMFPFYANPDKHATWVCNLEFLVRATKFYELIEKIEHRVQQGN